MRVSLAFVVILAAGVLGQVIPSSQSEMPTRTTDPGPQTSPALSSPTVTVNTLTTINSTPGSTAPTTTRITIVSSAAPPSGGGPTCVQRCLAQSATSVGCRNGADIQCVCGSETYLSLARACFTSSICDDATSQGAIQDYNRACSATTTSAETSWSTSSTESMTPSQTVNESLTMITTQTLALTSGAIVSVSRSVASTVTSGFTTIRTGQAGDFTTEEALAPTPSLNPGSSNNAALGLNMGQLPSFGMMMGLGVMGGVAMLVL